MTREYFARPGQLLRNHMRQVSETAAAFAGAFGGQSEARIAGLLHDLGKYKFEFQDYLEGRRPGGADTHHAPYGAAYAWERAWPACSFSIYGHHAGLPDLHDLQELPASSLYAPGEHLPTLVGRFRAELGRLPEEISLPAFIGESVLSLEFYIRMVFSCLVDADRLDAAAPGASPPSALHLAGHVEDMLARLFHAREGKSRQGEVNAIRHAVFQQCLEVGAVQPPGFFALTAPTGAGKTLSGMAFALAHAKAHDLRRVVVVIPYLSIIEQNAAEYRRIFDPAGVGLVIEDHSAVLPPPGDNETPSPLALAVENWDAPLVVTTSVQFVESLFAASPARCRKLHNLAGAMVVMDEVQTLPVRLLTPLLNVLRELKDKYGASFLLMTATQPAFRRSESLREGFDPGELAEIAGPEATTLFQRPRVRYEMAGTLNWPTLAQMMADVPRCLCILNVRRHARELWEELRRRVPEQEREAVFHLSSSMCAEHRMDLLGDPCAPGPGSIRHALRNGLPCRVVSTQVVEAGVDLDFPLVLRALGPLDSMVQAAGRCNREGALVDATGRPIPGRVMIFAPADPALPPGIYTTATGHACATLDRVGVERLGLDPGLFAEYFAGLYQMTPTDHRRNGECSIQEDRESLRFRETARKARVIEEDDMAAVAVPYGDYARTIEDIRQRPSTRGRPRFGRTDLRRLQRCLVNVRRKDLVKLHSASLVRLILPEVELFVLEEGVYHSSLGLLVNSQPLEDMCGV